MADIDFKNDILPLKDKLFRLALRIVLSVEEAEDVVQDSLIKIWQRRDRWEEVESVEAFCLTMCRNRALDKVRARGGWTSSEQEHDDMPDVQRTPEEKADLKDQVRLVREIMNSLPEKQRTAMHLRDFDGRQYKEIATIMGISETQVKINIFRARQAVKRRFDEIE